MMELTDAEREFLSGHKGGVFSILAGESGPKSEARVAAGQAVAALADRYDSRTERLLVLAALAEQTKEARDELLRSLLRSSYTWTEVAPGDWRALGLQGYEVENLASLAGLSVSTVRRWNEEAIKETLHRAQSDSAVHDANPDDQTRALRPKGTAV